MARQEDRLTTDDLASRREGSSAEREPAGEETVARELHDETARGETTGKAEGMTERESGARAAPETEPLLATAEADDYRARWETVQTGFVDEPRRSVEQADGLVADLMQRLADTFSEERKSLEGQWDRGEDVSTEDLRVALQRYRSFFDRLLST